MFSNGLFLITIFFLLVLACTKPIGAYMARIFEGERTFLYPVIRPLERLVYRLSGIEEEREQTWTEYAGALLMFSIVPLLLTYAIQRLQGWLPFNPQGFGAKVMTPDLAFNTAVS